MKFRFLLIILLLAVKLQAQQPDASNPSSLNPAQQDSRIVAAQISTLDFEDREQLLQFFKSLKAAGVNTVIVRVFQNPGDGFYKLCAPAASTGYYFKTGSAPVVCDLLAVIAQEAHGSGLKIFAWMNSRYADYGIENRSDLHSIYYDFKTKSYKPAKGLCIFHPDVQARLAALYRDLAQYPIDGVLVQDDLMLRHNEDFSAPAVLRYLQERGKPAAPELFYQGVKNGRVETYSDAFWEWSRWKSEKLLDLADSLRAALREKNPSVRFGFNFYYETGLKPEQALCWFSQDVKLASARKYDFYSLMLYHRQIQDELKLTPAGLLSALRKASDEFVLSLGNQGQPLIKLMTRDFKTGQAIPEPELERVVRSIGARGQSGVAFFPVWGGMEKELSNLILDWENHDEKNSRGAVHPGDYSPRRVPAQKP